MVSAVKEEVVMSFYCIRAAFGVSYTSEQGTRCPSLAVFKARLHKALKNLVSGVLSLPLVWVLG